MSHDGSSGFTELSLDGATIEGEASFAHVALYGELKKVLRKSDDTFRVLPPTETDR